MKMNSKNLNKYPTTVGVELTYSLKKITDYEHVKKELIKSNLTQLRNNISLKHKKARRFCNIIKENITTDSSIEMPTPILKTKDDADLAWYISDYVTKEAYGLQKRQLQTSGGHIHIGFKNDSFDKKKYFYNMTIWMVNRPWFAWAINDPSDTKNSKSWLSFITRKKQQPLWSFFESICICTYGFRKIFKELKEMNKTNSFEYNFRDSYTRNYTHIIRPNIDTIEFRFF